MRPSNPRGKSPHRAADSRPRKPAYKPPALACCRAKRNSARASPTRARRRAASGARAGSTAAMRSPRRWPIRSGAGAGWRCCPERRRRPPGWSPRHAPSGAHRPRPPSRSRCSTAPPSTALLPEGAVHQGWALQVEPLDPADLDDVLRAAEVTPGRSVVVVLDRVADPHNVGAILRSAAAFGAAAVVLPEHGAPPQTGGARQGRLGRARPGAAGARRQSGPRPRPAEGGGLLVLRPRRKRGDAARRPRSRPARRAGARRRRRRAAPPGARALRLPRPAADPAGHCRASTSRTPRRSRSTNWRAGCRVPDVIGARGPLSGAMRSATTAKTLISRTPRRRWIRRCARSSRPNSARRASRN